MEGLFKNTERKGEIVAGVTMDTQKRPLDPAGRKPFLSLFLY